MTLAHSCHVSGTLQAPRMKAAVEPAEPIPVLDIVFTKNQSDLETLSFRK